MKQVYIHRDITRVGHYRSLLEEAQIQTHIRNENDRYGAMFSPESTDPALCVVNDADYEAALKIIEAHEYPDDAVTGEVWKCDNCAEEVGPELDVCWNCDTARSA